jgi:hypothetical protein
MLAVLALRYRPCRDGGIIEVVVGFVRVMWASSTGLNEALVSDRALVKGNEYFVVDPE